MSIARAHLLVGNKEKKTETENKKIVKEKMEGKKEVKQKKI